MWDKIKRFLYLLFELEDPSEETEENDKVYSPLPPAFDIFKKTIKDIRKDKKIKRLTERSKTL